MVLIIYFEDLVATVGALEADVAGEEVQLADLDSMVFFIILLLV